MAVAPDLETAAAETYNEMFRINNDAGLSIDTQVGIFLAEMFGATGVLPADDPVDKRVVRDWYGPIAYGRSLLEGTGPTDTTVQSAYRQADPIQRVMEASVVAEAVGIITGPEATGILAAWNTAIGGA